MLVIAQLIPAAAAIRHAGTPSLSIKDLTSSGSVQYQILGNTFRIMVTPLSSSSKTSSLWTREVMVEYPKEPLGCPAAARGAVREVVR